MLTPREVAEIIRSALPEPGPGWSGDLRLEGALCDLYNPVALTDNIAAREVFVRMFLSQVGVELLAQRLWCNADRAANEQADAEAAAQRIAERKVARAHGRKARRK